MADPDQDNWTVYMIEASDGSFYTGITTDLDRRFREHLEGRNGARYFRGRKPVSVVYSEAGHCRSSALKREAAIKKLGKADKLKLASAPAAGVELDQDPPG